MVSPHAIKAAAADFRLKHPLIARDVNEQLRLIDEKAQEIADAINKMFESRPKIQYAYIVFWRPGYATDYIIKISRSGAWRILRVWRFHNQIRGYREPILRYDGVEVY